MKPVPLPNEAPVVAPKKKRRKKRRPEAGVDTARQAPAVATPATVARPVMPRPERAPEARPVAPRVEDLARRALAEIDRLVALVARELGVPAVDTIGDEAAAVTLTLSVPLAVPAGDQAERTAALLKDVRERVGAASESAVAFLEGHVYCFQTHAPDSMNSRPTHPTDVFAGYAPTGKPEWISFANLCLARKEPRVDRLYGDAPEVLAFVQRADELDEDLLPSFGRDSLVYRLLGQVVLGLVPNDLDPRSRAERVALSLQLVETSQPGLRHRLRLNVIGLPAEAIAQAAADQPETSAAEAFRKVLRATRGRVDALGRRAALAHRSGESFDLVPHATMLLNRLRGDVLRVLKLRDYRTRHAEERHQSGERPTSLAIADALAAGEGRFFRDEHKNTIVVLGPKHRVHVFTTSGRHVTSLELQPTEVERRLELKRWRFLERIGSDLFKDTLKRALNPDDFAAPASPAARPS